MHIRSHAHSPSCPSPQALRFPSRLTDGRHSVITAPSSESKARPSRGTPHCTPGLRAAPYLLIAQSCKGTSQPKFLRLIFWNQIRLVNRPVAFSSISQPSFGTEPDFLGLPQRCLLFTEQTSSQNQLHFSNAAGQRGRGKITGIRGHLGSFRIELFSEQAINPVALKELLEL